LKGTSGNPAGRPEGARNRLQSSFLYALAKDFEEHGEGAIRIMRVERPAEYVKVVASLMPKEFLVTDNALGEMSDDELLAAIQSIRQLRASALNGVAVDVTVPALKVISHD
jgi:hypothetical protein